jgi:NitT/TauT family transport system substrate-binding protein
LKGKSIGISENTIIDYSLDVILKNKGLSSSDIKKEIVPRMPDRYEMLNNGKLDFGLLPEPFSTLALNNGAINLGSASEIDLYPAISAFSQDALDEKLEAIQNVFKAYNEAVQYMNETDVKEYEDLVIEKIGYPEEMAGNIEMQKFRENTLPTKEDMEAAIKWASERDLCSPDLTYEQLVFDVTAN